MAAGRQGCRRCPDERTAIDMAQRNNKYAYDRNYYRQLAQEQAFNGNAARQLKVVPDYDEDDWEEEDDDFGYEDSVSSSSQYNSDQVRRPLVENQPYTKTKVRYSIKIRPIPVIVFCIAIAALLYVAFNYLEVQSDLSQADKQIKIAETKLADVKAMNASLSATLDTEIDRNYIYTVAVAKLGMVYPDKNQVAYYEPAGLGYVRQMASIPLE